MGKKKKNRDGLTNLEQERIADQLFELLSSSNKSSSSSIFDTKPKKKKNVDDLTEQIDRHMIKIAKNNLSDENDKGDVVTHVDEEFPFENVNLPEIDDDEVIGFNIDLSNNENQKIKNATTYGVMMDKSYGVDECGYEESDSDDVEYKLSDEEICNDLREICEFVNEEEKNKWIKFKARAIRVRIIDELGKLIIDDGIFPTVISIPHIKETRMDEEFVNMMINCEADEDGEKEYDFTEYVANLLYFIIATKHPTAVFTIDEYMSAFSHIVDMNTKDLIFFTNNEYVFFYLFNDEDRDKIYNLLDDMDSIDFIRALYTIVLNSSTVHQAFFADDKDYIERFRNSEYNNTEYWINYILRHEDTEEDPNATSVGSLYLNDDVFNLMVKMNVIDLDGYRALISSILDELVYVDEDNIEFKPDEERFTPLVNTDSLDVPEPTIVEENNELLESVIVEQKVQKMNEVNKNQRSYNIDDIDDLVEGLESVDVDDTSETEEDDSNDMVVPVIRRK